MHEEEPPPECPCQEMERNQDDEKDGEYGMDPSKMSEDLTPVDAPEKEIKKGEAEKKDQTKTHEILFHDRPFIIAQPPQGIQHAPGRVPESCESGCDFFIEISGGFY